MVLVKIGIILVMQKYPSFQGFFDPRRLNHVRMNYRYSALQTIFVCTLAGFSSWKAPHFFSPCRYPG